MKNIFVLLTLVAAVSAYPYSEHNFQNEEYGFVQGRIVGGKEAEEHSAPYVVTMQWGSSVDFNQCGGSIIHANWVLTAAHCTDAAPLNFRIFAGRHNLKLDESLTEQRRDLTQSMVIRHNSYAGGVNPFDISLIRVDDPFIFTPEVRPIQLPQQDHIPSGDAILFGWGSISLSASPNFPDTLQTVEKPIIPMNQCGNVMPRPPLHDTNVCAGTLTGGDGACSGDSGGPLVQYSFEHDNVQLIGIVSWGRVPCGSFNSPTVYTRVSAFVDWILVNTNDDFRLA